MKNTLLVIGVIIIGGCSINMTIGKADKPIKRSEENNSTSPTEKKD